MNFKKLALASAIATLPMGAFALDEITDDALSEVSGQDGISMTLGIGTNGIQTDIYLHDKDGLGSVPTSTSYSFDGAIVIDNMAIAVGGANIVINIDAGDRATSASAPILNVAVTLPTSLTISTGSIHVANSQRDNTAWSVDGISSTILSNMNIVLGSTTLNIQLGNEVQQQGGTGPDMMVMTSSITNGLVISNFQLSDANSSGGIGSTSMTVLNNGSSTILNLAIDANVTTSGLVIGLNQVGAAGTGMDIRIVDQYLGTSTNAKLGDVSIVGLNLNGSTLTINGK